MKCPNCDQVFVIKTDPEKATYKYVSGLKKMYSSYFDSKKQVKSEMLQKQEARKDMGLNDKVKYVNNEI